MAGWRSHWNPEMETMAPGDLRVLEEARLREQVDYVAGRSGFYGRKLAEAGVRPGDLRAAADLRRLPVTTKEELRKDQEAHPPFGMYTAAPLEEIVRVHKTSGSSGRPLYIALTARDAELVAECGARAFWSAGLRPSDIVVHCLNYCQWLGGYTDHASLERTGAAVLPFGVGNSRALVRTIRDLGVTAISSTPSYPGYLEAIVEEELGLPPRALGLRLGLFGGEPGMAIPGTRRRIEETWGLTARDANYGLSDVLSNFAAECPERPELHFLGQGAILCQLLDPAAGSDIGLEKGAVGELVFTTLRREGQPLLRYRSGDVVEILATNPCACGRTGFRFRVLGRSDDMLIVRGVNVFPSAVEDVLGRIPDLTGAFQILVDRPQALDRLRLRVEAAPSVTEDAWPRLAGLVGAQVKTFLGVTPEVQVVGPRALPRTEGKAKRLVRLYAGEGA